MSKMFRLSLFAVTFVFGVTFMSCSSGSSSSSGSSDQNGSIIGTWESPAEEMTLNGDGSFEIDNIDGTPSFKGTYSATDDSITRTIDFMYGPSFAGLLSSMVPPETDLSKLDPASALPAEWLTPEQLEEAVQKMLTELGMPPDQIELILFGLQEMIDSAFAPTKEAYFLDGNKLTTKMDVSGVIKETVYTRK
ncbi:MAG: hypothetical protein LBR60_03285 [Fibrobacter sp.]|jgi:hypothetical protein|nr:hypothetical protein [Fibrobacter sp.]